MKISKQLNIVVSTGDEGDEVYFHSTPILFETFKKYVMVISKTFNELMSNELHASGSRIAAMVLEDIAIKMGEWEGNDGVQNGLMNEIDRLTNVIAITEKGWNSIPLSVAISQKLIDEDSWREAKQRIVFFILVCAMMIKREKEAFFEYMNSTFEMQTTYLNCTDFANSLTIPTKEEITSPEETQLSIAS